MKIYTKTGDSGSTSLFGGKRVSKDDLRISAYGTIDELNAHLGLLNAQISDQQVHEEVLKIQNELFVIGSYLAADPAKPGLKLPVFSAEAIVFLELAIDRMESMLPPLQHFILPSGSVLVAQAHVCRTVCRRAERCMVELHHAEPINDQLLIYINRLSDYLFVLSRYLALGSDTKEIPWIPKSAQ